MKLFKQIWLKASSVALSLAVLCAPATCLAAGQSPLLSGKAQTTLQAVELRGDGDKAELVITTSAPATYTSYKTSDPAKFVVDFAQTVPTDAVIGRKLARGAVKDVVVKRYDTDAGVLTRMEIVLVQDTDTVITPTTDRSGTLHVTFPGYHSAVQSAESTVSPVAKPEVAAQKVAQAGTGVLTVTAVTARDQFIEIAVDGAVGDFKVMRLKGPERLVVDVMAAKAAPGLKLSQINALGVATARVAAHPDKVRIVLDAVQDGMPDAKVERVGDGLAVMFEGTAGTAKAEVAKKAAVVVPENRQVSGKPVQKEGLDSAKKMQLDAIDFQVLDAVARLSLKVSGSAAIEQPVKSAGFVTLKLSNTSLPKHLQRSIEAREFNSPVLRITPISVKTKVGQDVLIRVALKQDVPFELRSETDVHYLEFKVPAKPVEQLQTAQSSKAAAADMQTVDKLLVQEEGKKAKPVYAGRKVTLEFADAEVRKIFQLLSEVSNKNFVLGDEVSGTISLKLVNVPWDQALDIILETKGLDKREEGNIVLIRGKGKFKSLLEDEADMRKAALRSEPLETMMFDVNYASITDIVSQFKELKTDRGVITSDARTNKVIVKDVKTALEDMKKILKSLDVPEKQVMIEARIIEASTSFTRSLGIHWGVSTSPNAGGQNFPFVNSMVSSFGGLTNTAPTSGGLLTVVPGAFSDIVFGTIGANVRLQMRINAAATAGLVKIISTPKVATLNNKTAKIVQGQQIPYTSATADKIETKFIEAALSLEVTPHINANGTISMKIDAKNDAPDRQTSVGQPPINKKQATTEMLLRDGETTVIGGIYVDRDTEGADGVPWLMDIPFIGHLFKSTNIEKSKSELLIFVTPRILNNV